MKKTTYLKLEIKKIKIKINYLQIYKENTGYQLFEFLKKLKKHPPYFLV